MGADRTASPSVTCEGLSRTFGAGSANAVEALSPLDIVFGGGTTTAIVGPSGCGKSTILRLIAGLETPTGGSVLIGGETPDAVKRRGGLAMAFQDASLLPWRTVRGNVGLARRLARQSSDPVLVDRLIAMVGLSGFETARPGQLSGGMRQRTAIARCLVTAPDLLLLDEPFGAVDELTRLRLGQELPALWRKAGTTAIMVTHSVAEAVFVADRILVMSDRPAHVVADIPVTLPYPRTAEMTRSADFHRIANRVAAALTGASIPDPADADAA